MSRKRILLADDHELFRNGLTNIISAQPDFEVVGQATDGLEAFQLAYKLKPDLVIMDIRMPISDGIEATSLIRNKFPEIKVLILTVQEDDDSLFAAIQAGANGYMLKSASSVNFVENIRSVLNGHGVVAPRLASRLLTEFARLASHNPLPVASGGDYALTGREEEILTLIAAGNTNEEIADFLIISIHTVKTHVRNILKKLQANSRNEAAQIARQQGLLPGTSSPKS